MEKKRTNKEHKLLASFAAFLVTLMFTGMFTDVYAASNMVDGTYNSQNYQLSCLVLGNGPDDNYAETKFSYSKGKIQAWERIRTSYYGEAHYYETRSSLTTKDASCRMDFNDWTSPVGVYGKGFVNGQVICSTVAGLYY